jgi:hypothetical protein
MQFFLLLKLFGVDIPLLNGIIFICAVFFVTTVIPTIGLADLGIRGTAALTVFSFYFGENYDMTEKVKLALITTTTTLWLINLIIPAIAGSFFVFRLKFFRKKYS